MSRPTCAKTLWWWLGGVLALLFVIVGTREAADSPPPVSSGASAPAPLVRAALSYAQVSARARLIGRLARKGLRNDATREAAALLRGAPGFSAREWVERTYGGVKRDEDREAEVRLLVGLGLPETAGGRTATGREPKP